LIVKINSISESPVGNTVVSIRCPSCRHKATFEKVLNIDLKTQRPFPSNPKKVENVFLGQRRCPEPKCRAHVFFITAGGKVLASYPTETIDFDASSLPESVISAFSEAITCHANKCFTAAAIMVRKTLEELCRDREAKGKNLKQRIKALKDKVVLPQELLDGTDDLRLLGNDAAHIESQNFNQVSKEEVEVGIEFTKEVLKAVYQYKVLLDRLRSLKK